MREWPRLPRDVAAHVTGRMRAIPWDKVLEELQGACRDCPIRHDPDRQEVCDDCPLYAVALTAARVATASRLARGQTPELAAYYATLPDDDPHD